MGVQAAALKNRTVGPDYTGTEIGEPFNLQMKDSSPKEFTTLLHLALREEVIKPRYTIDQNFFDLKAMTGKCISVVILSRLSLKSALIIPLFLAFTCTLCILPTGKIKFLNF